MKKKSENTHTILGVSAWESSQIPRRWEGGARAADIQMSTLGVKLRPSGDVDTEDLVPHDVKPRLEGGRDGRGPEIRTAIPVLELRLIPQATLQPSLQDCAISVSNYSVCHWSLSCCRLGLELTASLPYLEKVQLVHVHVLAGLAAIREPHAHWTDGMQPPPIHGGEVIAGRDGDVRRRGGARVVTSEAGVIDGGNRVNRGPCPLRQPWLSFLRFSGFVRVIAIPISAPNQILPHV